MHTRTRTHTRSPLCTIHLCVWFTCHVCACVSLHSTLRMGGGVKGGGRKEDRKGMREGGKTDEQEGGKRLPCSLCCPPPPSRGVSPQAGSSKGVHGEHFPGPPTTKNPTVRFLTLAPAEDPTVPKGLEREDIHCKLNLSLAAGARTP